MYKDIVYIAMIVIMYKNIHNDIWNNTLLI